MGYLTVISHQIQVSPNGISLGRHFFKWGFWDITNWGLSLSPPFSPCCTASEVGGNHFWTTAPSGCRRKESLGWLLVGRELRSHKYPYSPLKGKLRSYQDGSNQMQVGDSTEGRDSFSMRYVDSSAVFFEAIHHYGYQWFTYIYMYVM